MIVARVPDEALDLAWRDAAPLLANAVATLKKKFNVDGIRKAIESGDLALWVVMDEGKTVAAFTTRIIEYPEGRAMAIDWVGGKSMKGWLDDGLELMEQYAKDFDCKHLEGFGTRAWGRVLKRFGWGPEYIAYRKDLTNE